MIGMTVSHYKILEKIGGGGMGVVYKAQDTRLKRTVALKFLPPDLTRDDEAKTRFTHEAQAASALQHPNICTIHDIDETADHQLFIVMDCYEGGTLKQRIEKEPLPVETAIDIAIQVTQGLAKAHSSGIVHRDIKPANIVVGEDGIARILDFGLAKLSTQTILTKTGSTLGTAAYMSPEQARGEKVDHRTDIWSLGVVLYEMVTGHRPFASEYEQALLYSIMNQTPDAMTVSRKDVPIKLEQIVSTCLEKDPSRRYQSADDLLVALREARQGTARPVKGLLGELLARTIWGRRRWGVRAALVGIPLVLILSWYVYVTYFGAPSESIPIAVLSFENLTGDSTYNNLQEAIPNLLITKLEQSSYLRVATWERVRDLLKLLGKAGSSFVDNDLGFELAQRDSARAVIRGTYVKAGNVFAIDVKIYDVITKKILKTMTSRGEGPGSIYDQIDELGGQISAGFGIPSSEVKAEEKPIREVTTASMEAYGYFLRGREDFEKMLVHDAIRFLSKAVEIDSTFAMAYYYLALAFQQNGDPLMKPALQNAMRYADRSSRKERLLIEQYHAARIERNREKSYNLLLQLEEQFPGDKRVHHFLGIYYLGKGQQVEHAVASFNRALALDPSWTLDLNTLGYVYLSRLGEYGKAVEIFKRYAAASPGEPNPFDSMGEAYFFRGKLDSAVLRFEEVKLVRPDWTMTADAKLSMIHALKEDYAQAFRSLENFSAKNEFFVGVAHLWKSFLYSWLGAPSRARGELDKMLRPGEKSEDPAEFWLQGVMALAADRMDEAQNCFRECYRLRLAKNPADSLSHCADYKSLQAIVALKAGDLRSAESDLATVRAVLSPSAEGAAYLGPLVHNAEAELLLAKGQIDEAIGRFLKQPQLTYVHFSPFWPGRLATTNILVPRDGLARAYVRKGDLDAAIREYERITTFDPSNGDRRFIQPLHRYELAKLYDKKGMKDKAIAQYERFLSLWKNADHERQEPKDAQIRMLRLRGKK